MANGSTQRSKSEIEADIAAARARLSGGVEELIDQVHPKRIKERQVENVKTFAQGELNRAKAEFKDSRDGWRTDRLLLVGGSVAGIAAFLVTVRALVSRARSRD